MEDLPGSFGTSPSFSLRLGQTVFSAASLFFMGFDDYFYNYTSFCFLVTVMALVTPWCVTLALVDAYSLFIKRIPQRIRIVSLIITGDFFLSILAFAAACSAASVTDILLDAGPIFCSGIRCFRFQLSAAMCFMSWSLSFASFLFNLWHLPSLIAF